MIVLVFQRAILSCYPGRESCVSAEIGSRREYKAVARIISKRRLIRAGQEVCNSIRPAVWHAEEGPAQAIFERHIAAHFPGIPEVGFNIVPTYLREGIGLNFATAPAGRVPQHIKGAIRSGTFWCCRPTSCCRVACRRYAAIDRTPIE